IAMVDTNCDPTVVDYPIPANDDAIRAIRLVTGRIADAALEGNQLREAAFIEPTDDSSREEAEELAAAAADATAAAGAAFLPVDDGQATPAVRTAEEELEAEVAADPAEPTAAPVTAAE